MKTAPEILEGLRKDEFTFFYQPKISLITGKVIGAEALIRWIKPDGKLIPPAEFIPVAEQSSLISQISQHMFPKLVKDMLLLTDVEDLSLAFNASAKDFENGQFTHLVLETLDHSQIDPARLQIELTETVTLREDPNIRENILPLRNAGVGLAMDDFGKGYSSIDTLSRWPFTTIKLDHDIISRMLDSDKNATIVDSAIRMAHELGISVVAEGVETNAQYHHLLAAGCTKVQGYWISKALPLHDFITFINQDIRWSGLPIGLIHMATIDHVQWRKQLVTELVKVVSLPKDSPHRKYLNTPPLSCHDCRLGRWYYGAGQGFRSRTSFLAVEQPHMNFHEIGNLLIKMVGNGANMEDLTPQLRALSDASMEVMHELQTLENEGLMDMHTAHEAWTSHAFHPQNKN